ncbi:MAG: hypothetical protein ACOCZ8_02965 [Bacteroidota bacterium]
MSQGLNTRRLKRLSALPYAVAIVLWALAFGGYRAHVGMDQVSYLAIAEQYAAGEFAAAVNAYWSPLISWLLAPCIAVGIDSLLAYQLLVLGMLLLGVWALGRLGEQLRLRKAVSTLVQIAVIVPMLYYASIGFLADSLSAVLLMALLGQGIVVWRTSTWRAWIGLASIGLAASFAKQYNLGFVLGVMALVVVARVLRQRRKQPGYSFTTHLFSFWKKASTLVLILLAGVGSWVAILSTQYDDLLWSSAGAYNLELAHCHGRHPIQQGFQPPLPTHRYAGWQEPTLYEWPQKLRCNGKEGLSGVRQEAYIAFNALLVRDYEWLFLLVLLPGFWLGFKWRRTVVLLLALATVYALPYLFLVLNPRYLLFSALLVIVSAGLVISRLRRRWMRVGLLALLLWVVAAHDGTMLTRYWLPAEAHTAFSETLSDTELPAQPNIAVFGEAIKWAAGQTLAFRLNGRFFGRVTNDFLEK